jgi:hypothetical protein
MFFLTMHNSYAYNVQRVDEMKKKTNWVNMWGLGHFLNNIFDFRTFSIFSISMLKIIRMTRSRKKNEKIGSNTM